MSKAFKGTETGNRYLFSSNDFDLSVICFKSEFPHGTKQIPMQNSLKTYKSHFSLFFANKEQSKKAKINYKISKISNAEVKFPL